MFLFIIKLIVVGAVLTFVSLFLTVIFLPLLTFWISSDGVRSGVQKLAAFTSAFLICGFVGAYQANLAEIQPTTTGYWIVVIVSIFIYSILSRGFGQMHSEVLAQISNEDSFDRASISSNLIQLKLIEWTKILHPIAFLACLILPGKSNHFFLELPMELINLF